MQYRFRIDLYLAPNHSDDNEDVKGLRITFKESEAIFLVTYDAIVTEDEPNDTREFITKEMEMINFGDKDVFQFIRVHASLECYLQPIYRQHFEVVNNSQKLEPIE